LGDRRTKKIIEILEKIIEGKETEKLKLARELARIHLPSQERDPIILKILNVFIEKGYGYEARNTFELLKEKLIEIGERILEVDITNGLVSEAVKMARRLNRKLTPEEIKRIIQANLDQARFRAAREAAELLPDPMARKEWLETIKNIEEEFYKQHFIICSF
jgi:hypothetical protein